MTNRVTKNKMLKSNYVISCSTINKRYNKSEVWKKKNALRELNQKRIKCDREIIKKKNECKVGKGIWNCPQCSKNVSRLTCAHVGKPVCKIIDKVLEENPNEDNICKLDIIVQERHKGAIIVICCDDCNSFLDDTK